MLRLFAVASLCAVSSPQAEAQPPCAASSNPNMEEAAPFRHFTADVGGGFTGKQGAGLQTGFNVRGSVGRLLSPQPERYDNCGSRLRPRHWSLYFTLQFLFNQLDLASGAAQQIALGNPQNPSLLSAQGGTARYYSWTLDPEFRYRFKPYASLYMRGGFGALYRTIDFSGAPNGVPVVQTPNPAISGFSATSGAYDAGFGLNIGPIGRTSGIIYYIEVRRLQGLGFNSANTLWPVSFGIRW